VSLTSLVITSFIQGLTEFLPISSSGHLLLYRLIFTPYEQPLTFDVFLHFGSLLAIIWFFRNVIRGDSIRLLPALIIGTLPAVFAGLFIYDHFQSIFETPQFLGISFLITSLFLFIFNFLPQGKTVLLRIKPFQALIIGLFQAIALLPGVSRSGSTIFAGKLSGLKSIVAFQFAFLLAIPAIIGAISLVLKEQQTLDIYSLQTGITGLIFSFLSSLIALRLLKFFLESKNLKIFFWYTLILGSFCLGIFI